MGWMGLLFKENLISRIKFGFGTEIQLLRSIDESFDVIETDKPSRKWVNSLKKFVAGKEVDLSAMPLELDGYSRFQQTVLKNCRKIPYGTTISYGELAAKSNSPNAARAVGTTMKKNRFPLVIPCHRVVASNGVGGYSAADGVSIKRKLLALEGVFI